MGLKSSLWLAPRQAELQRGIPSAHQYLIQSADPAACAGKGAVLVELSHSRGWIVAIGRLIPLACSVGQSRVH